MAQCNQEIIFSTILSLTPRQRQCRDNGSKDDIGGGRHDDDVTYYSCKLQNGFLLRFIPMSCYLRKLLTFMFPFSFLIQIQSYLCCIVPWFLKKAQDYSSQLLTKYNTNIAHYPSVSPVLDHHSSLWMIIYPLQQFSRATAHPCQNKYCQGDSHVGF